MDRTPIDIAIDEKLLHATVKLNTLLCAGVSSLVAGLGALCATYFMMQGGLPETSYFLDLVGLFLPGYEVSTPGAWIGFLWGALFGAIAGGVTYRFYARSIRRQVSDYAFGSRTSDSLENIVLSLYGHPLGLALGGVLAFCLLISTNWVASLDASGGRLRAAELLSHYFPGYSLTLTGSIVGALEVWLLVYVLCRLLSGIYNYIARRRKARTLA
jgi:hypothetical protein